MKTEHFTDLCVRLLYGASELPSKLFYKFTNESNPAKTVKWSNDAGCELNRLNRLNVCGEPQTGNVGKRIFQSAFTIAEIHVQALIAENKRFERFAERSGGGKENTVLCVLSVSPKVLE